MVVIDIITSLPILRYSTYTAGDADLRLCRRFRSLHILRLLSRASLVRTPGLGCAMKIVHIFFELFRNIADLLKVFLIETRSALARICVLGEAKLGECDGCLEG